MNPQEIIKLSVYAGETMLKYGAETYRVEDTMCRIMAAYGITAPEAFATTTGIFASMEDKAHGLVTVVRRVKQRTINLEKIAMVNALSRAISAGDITVSESYARLMEINKSRSYSRGVRAAFVALGCGAACYLFKGSLWDCLASAITCMTFYLLNLHLTSRQVSGFLVNILSGGVISIAALLLVNLGIGTNLDKVITGAIMPLVPGVGITNAVRDIIEGDFLSGSNRIVEAMMVAVAIAVGVGTVLKIWLMLFGRVTL